MISSKTIKKSEARQILKLIEQWTRAEIMARLGKFDNLEFADYAQVQVEIKDEIRELIFDTSSLVELGNRWNMLSKKHLRRKKKKKKKRTKK